MKNEISKEFTFLSLLAFATPTIAMMIVLSLYTIIDSMFVARYVGTNALSAINIVYPVINVIIGLAIMLATGASAIIARKMGDKDEHSARQDFSAIVAVGLIVGIVIIIIGLVFIEPIIRALGATDLLYDYCYQYLYILLLFAPASILQMLFQIFFVTAGKPTLGLILTISAGLVNVVLDYIFIALLGMGIGGAALATGIGYMIPAFFGMLFFLRKKSALHFVMPKFNLAVIAESCFNGSSEMVTNLSMGVTTFLFNIIMLKYLGEDGVAAITIVLYAHFLLIALFMGFSMGVSPIISYNHGSENFAQLKRIFKICIGFMLVSSVIVLGLSVAFASPLIAIFSPKQTPVYEIALSGFTVFCTNFLFAGVNIFASAMFTAFSNGKVSAIISLMRTFVFLVLGLLIMPNILGVQGIWLAIPVAELCTILISAFYLHKGRLVYNY